MKRRPSRVSRIRSARANGTRARALGGVDPRTLPAGTVYPCDDPRIGTRAAGDHFAGTVLACAVPPEGKRGRFFVVGGVESGAAISSARSRRERTREALRARWDGPDLDARPARGGRAKAPPPSSLAALPVPEARGMVLHREAPPARRPSTRPRTTRPPALFEALYPHAEPRVRVGAIEVPAHSTGMGELLELEVGRLADPDRVELWTFASPRPRLGFEHVAPSARGARISRLWIVGGAFYFDARGRFHGKGARSAARVRRLSGRSREAAARTRTGARYRDTHGGHAPREVVRAEVDLGQPLVPVGWLRAISYQTDKAERAPVDPAPYRHPFEPEARPLLCATADGRALVALSDRDVGAVRYEDPRRGDEYRAVRFGRYTVTPHGIEDIE